MAIPHKYPTKESVECEGCLAKTSEPYRFGWHVDGDEYLCRRCNMALQADPEALLPCEQASDQEIQFATSQGIDLRTAFRRIQQFERRRRRNNR